jgi:hypothetical protein
MRKIRDYIVFVIFIIVVFGGVLIANMMRAEEKCIFKLYFIPFHTQTYVPVTKETIETDSLSHYQLGFYRVFENKIDSDQKPPSCIEIKELLECKPADLKINGKMIRLKFKSISGDLIYYVDQDGIVEKNNKERFRLDKKTMEKVTTKILYLSGVVDYTVLQLK